MIKAARENCKHRIRRGEVGRCIIDLRVCELVRQTLAVFGPLGLDSDEADRDSRTQAQGRFRRNPKCPGKPGLMKAAASRPSGHSKWALASDVWRWERRAISTFPKFPQQKIFSVGLTAGARRVTRAVRERSDRPSLGKHGKRKLDELHGARKARTASAKFGAVQRHGEALGLDQRWAGRAPVGLTLDGKRDANHGPDLARLAVVGFCR
jgi:hypothetical protein